jgi:hypothetical protein
MPDIAVLTQRDESFFIEVKTATQNNSIVLKELQLNGFADTPNCIFAFTEHNLRTIKTTMKKR